MRINNNKQNLTFKASILVLGTQDIEAAKRFAKPIISNSLGRRGNGFIVCSDCDCVLVVDKRTKEGREAQVAYHNMKRSSRRGNLQQAEQRRRIFDQKLAAAERDAIPMEFHA